MVEQGVRASVVRLPQVHDENKYGLASYLVEIAREKGVSAYVNDGLNRWSAVHRLDAAPVFRLALEAGAARAKYHAVEEEGVPFREVAEAIGRGLKVSVESVSAEDAASHFGGLGFAAAIDNPASSMLTRERLGWLPRQRQGFIANLERSPAYEA